MKTSSPKWDPLKSVPTNLPARVDFLVHQAHFLILLVCLISSTSVYVQVTVVFERFYWQLLTIQLNLIGN